MELLCRYPAETEEKQVVDNTADLLAIAGEASKETAEVELENCN